MRNKTIYINSSFKNSKEEFVKALRQQIKSVNKAYDEICIACIGTDRSTGDSLGPLVGQKIHKNKKFKVIGTLENPLHAMNINELSNEIKENTLVIAVDACLGKQDHVGSIMLYQGSINPGSGVNKKLTPIGDIGIAGIVNFGGFMDFLVLQNTRLNTVMKMADIISYGIKKAIQ